MEPEDMINWMLEEAKKSPTKIHHDFDTRFRVWVDQIIPSRVNAIRQSSGDVNYAMRMVRLTMEDGTRLKSRVFAECGEGHRGVPQTAYFIAVEAILNVVIAAAGAYLDEVKK